VIAVAQTDLVFANHVGLAVGDSIDCSAGAEVEILPLVQRGFAVVHTAGTASRTDHAELGAEVRAERQRRLDAATLGAEIYRDLTTDESNAIAATLDAEDAAALAALEGLVT
jgi:hypothetical protein